MTEHRYGPTSAGTVLLDLGADTGALVLYTPADLLGAEIDISPDTTGARRTHAAVRARPGPNGTRYAAVYEGLAAGCYTLWADHHRRPGHQPPLALLAQGTTPWNPRWPAVPATPSRGPCPGQPFSAPETSPRT